MAEPPLISCLMVTRPAPERLPLLRESLADFARQTWPRRELVIVVDAPDPAAGREILGAVAAAGAPGVRVEVSGRPLTLGALRNLSWSLAAGEIVCTYDDDDRHHPARLEEQAGALLASGRPALFLQEHLHLFVRERRVFRVNYRPAPFPAAVNTLMARRDLPLRFPETGPNANASEDLELANAIGARAAYAVLPDRAHLFLYQNHGANTCSDAHHRHLVEQMGSSAALMRRHEAALREGLAAFDLGPGPLIVAGRTEDAFVIERPAAAERAPAA